MRASRPGLAMWSMPLMPHMSPAAIGCSVVRSRGWLRSRRSGARSPRARRPGQPSPLEDETVTTAPSGISAGGLVGGDDAGKGHPSAPPGRVESAIRRPVRAASRTAIARRKRADAVFAASPRACPRRRSRHGSRGARARRGSSRSSGSVRSPSALRSTTSPTGLWVMHIPPDQRALRAVHLEARAGVFGREAVVQLRDAARSGSAAPP